MQEAYIHNKAFNLNDFACNPPAKGEYESCIFSSCSFADSDF
jgi:hypothetical protein